MDIYLALIIIIIIVIIFSTRESRVKICDNITKCKREWNLLAEYPNKAEAAHLLSKLHISMINFMRYLKLKYKISVTDEEINSEDEKKYKNNYAYKIVSAILKNYNPDNFYENNPKTSKETSFTVNKGESMYLCLRTKENPHKLVNYDILMFVMLHEISHIGNYDGWGHDKKFWTVFKFILHEAKNSGVYTPTDYRIYPENYCGLNVRYNPYYDDTLLDIIK